MPRWSGERPLRLIALAILMIGAGPMCPTDYPGRVPNGNWGGDHAGMVVTDTGASIQFDCGSGRISQPLLLDARGNFDLPGVFYRGGGPVRIDSLATGVPARYTGHSTFNALSLTMALNDGSPPSSYILTWGGNPNVLKCL